MKIYKEASSSQIVIKRDESTKITPITSSFTGWRWTSNDRSTLKIIDKSTGSSYSKDTASIKDINDNLIGNANSVEAYLDAFIGTSDSSVASSINHFLLDKIPNTVGAFSLRKVRGSATNSIEIRRDSDNALTNVILNGIGSISLTSLVSAGGTLGTWIGANNGYVKTWYDQENSNDAVQATNGIQPQIIDTGAIILLEGQPAIDFTTLDRYLLAPRLLSTGLWSIHVALEIVNLGVNQTILAQHDSTGSSGRTEFLVFDTANKKKRMFFNNGSSFEGSTAATDWTAGQHFVSNYGDNNNYIWKQDALSEEIIITGESVVPLNTGFRIGLQGATANDFKGKIQELLIWDSNQSANKTEIDTDINNFYSV